MPEEIIVEFAAPQPVEVIFEGQPTDISGKVDKVEGKGLSKTDVTAEMAASWDAKLSEETDPVFTAWDKDYTDLTNKPDIPSALSELTSDATHRTVTDVEKSAWDAKLSEETDPVFTAWDKDYTDLTNKPDIPSALSELTSDATHRTVTDVEKSAWDGKQASGSYELDTNKSADIYADALSTIKYLTVKAVKDYVDSRVSGVTDLCGEIDASATLWPSTGGTGVSGAILKGNTWIVNVAGSLGGQAFGVGDVIISKVDSPGQTDSNWIKLQTNITYVPADVANLTTAITILSTDAQFPSAKAVYDALQLKVTARTAITAGTKTKITYGADGLVTGGSDATTADFADSLNKRFCTDAQKTVIGNTSGTNTGDQDLSSLAPKTSPVFTGQGNFTTAPVATANYGTFNIGSGAFDGSTAGKFVGNAIGTSIAVNEASGYVGDLMDLQIGGSSKFKIENTGKVTVAGNMSLSGGISATGWAANFFNFTSSSVNPSTTGVFSWVSTVSNTGDQIGIKLAPTYNQTSGTANNTDLLINRTETAVGSGTQRLISAQVGSVEKFGIDNVGNGIFIGGVKLGSYTTATRPTHAAGKMIYVTDGSAGSKYQGSDGSTWLSLG